jgi:hypothetical protein
MSDTPSDAPAGTAPAADAPERTAAAGEAHDRSARVPGGPRWSDDTRGRRICIDWGPWLDSDRHIDPYLVWADMSRLAGFGGWGDEEDTARNDVHGRLWPVLVELDRAYPVPPLVDPKEVTPDVLAAMYVPGLYLRPLRKDESPQQQRRLRSRFFSARIAPDSVRHLLTSRELVRMQLGIPRLAEPDADPPNVVASTRGNVPRTVIGIIDDGCAFAHPAFCDAAGRTRVHFLWDQDPRRLAQAHWRPVEGMLYGAELRHPQLQAASIAAARSTSEEAAYAAVDYGPVRVDAGVHGMTFATPQARMPGTAMLRGSHGAATMYLAAGVERDLGDAAPLRVQWAAAGPPTQAQGDDSATRWPIIFVQLPARTLYDTSGGSLGVHVLDGIRYIIHRARSIPYEDRDAIANRADSASEPFDPEDPKAHATGLQPEHGNNNIVINVSFGAVAGPHDGTSILEQAMADIVRPDSDGDSHVWICLAAGNSHRQRTHARMTLAPGLSGAFSWHVGPDNPQESYLEIWLPELDVEGRSLSSDLVRSIEITANPPGGYPPCKVRCGQMWVCEAGDAECPAVTAGMVFARTVAQGLRGTMILLAVRATRAAQDACRPPLPPHGEWVIEVAALGEATDPQTRPAQEFVVHAWTERNDLLWGNLRAQQGRVVSEDPVPEPTEFTREAHHFFRAGRGAWPTRHLNDQMQPRLSMGSAAGVCGGGPGEFFEAGEAWANGHIAVAGGYRLADGEVSEYSAGGPHRHAPERTAPAAGAPTPAAHAPTVSGPRDRPDATAPSDAGTALPGVRVRGMRSASVRRLAGTSAAAPSVARAIANFRHAVAWDLDGTTPDDPWQLASLRQRCGIELDLAAGSPAPSDPARTTPTPRKDDLYRRGKWRVR